MLSSFLWILTAVVLAGVFVTAVTFPGMLEWYPSLRKPAFTAPDWLFGIIWPILYALLILSAYFAYESLFNGPARAYVVLLFAAIIIGIALWPYVFFYRRSVLGGLIVAIFLLIATIVYMWWVSQIGNPLAFALIAPLVVWVAYCTYLSFGFYIHNRHC